MVILEQFWWLSNIFIPNMYKNQQMCDVLVLNNLIYIYVYTLKGTLLWNWFSGYIFGGGIRHEGPWHALHDEVGSHVMTKHNDFNIYSKLIKKDTFGIVPRLMSDDFTDSKLILLFLHISSIYFSYMHIRRYVPMTCAMAVWYWRIGDLNTPLLLWKRSCRYFTMHE